MNYSWNISGAKSNFGLPWPACAIGTPVVSIADFTRPTNEFDAPYHIIDGHPCDGCWSDVLKSTIPGFGADARPADKLATVSAKAGFEAR